MGERDNHIATRTSPRPRRRLLTHGHGEEEVDDGVDGEVQPREEAAAGGGHGGGGGEEETAAALGGGGGPRGQRLLGPLLPCGWCCNGAGPPLQDGGLGGGKFVALGDLGFLSLYRLSDSRHQILGLSKTGFTRPSGLRFGRILYPEASPRNSPQLSQLDFFRLTSSSGRNVTIFKKRSQTDFRKVRVLLQYDSFCVFVNFQVIPTQ